MQPGDISDKHIMKFNDVEFWVDMKCLSTFYKPVPYEIEWSNLSTDHRQATLGPDELGPPPPGRFPRIWAVRSGTFARAGVAMCCSCSRQ